MPKGPTPQALARQVVDTLLAATGPEPRVAVAFSGGLDSTALAHMLVKRRRSLRGLRLIHVDHGLQSASRAWSEHCAKQARDWKVPFQSLRANTVIERGASPEAAAREARYRALAGELKPGEVLVTAQHVEDQAETLLLQLLRGAGVPGLAAMPALAPFAAGELHRPLLTRSRGELAFYARKQRLSWIEDPTNQQDRFARNYLRHRILPLLRDKWPGADRAIARSATHLAEAAGLLEANAASDLLALADGDALNVAALRRLEPARRRNAIRAFITRSSVETPSAATMREICGTLLEARGDAQPEVRWAGAAIRRRAGRLELKVAPNALRGARPEFTRGTWTWKTQREWVLNRKGGVLTLIDDPAGPVDLDALPATLDIRARAGGETLRPGPRARTRALKKLLQDAKLTVEDRARLPLLFSGEGPEARLLAVGDRWIDASIAANVKSRRRARLIWRVSA